MSRRLREVKVIGAELRPRSAGPFYKSARPDRVHVARTHRQDQVAAATFVAQEALGGGVVARPDDALAAARVVGRLGDEQAGDAGEVLRALARGIHVEDHGQVGGGERAPERGRLALRAREQVRLEAGEHAPGPERARGGDRRRDLGRVVGVVVDDLGAVRGVPEPLEAPARRPRRSPAASAAAATSAPASRIAVSAAAALRALCSPGTDERARPPSASKTRRALREPRRSSGGHHLFPREREEGAERVVDVAPGGVGRVVVELGVGDDRDRRRELEQAAVGLVGLDHEPLPRPPAGVGAGAADLAADQVAESARQRVHEHARGRRLAVGAGDGDRRLQARDLAEQVGAVQLRRAALGVARPGSRTSRRPRRPRARSRRRGRCAGSMPAARSVARVGRAGGAVGAGDDAPSACATTARPLIPAPPIPTKCSFLPDQGWSIPVTLGRLADESRIDRVAREAFGYAELRPGQREGIEAALAGHDALVVMSTGSGKSAIYQIAGLLTPGRDDRRLAADRAPARPGGDAERARGGRRGAAELDDRGRRARARAARAGRGHARVPLPRARAARAGRT